MAKLFKHSQHLFRIAGLFLLGLVVFVVLRGIFIPKGFGELGHYRVGALKDNQSLPVVFAGRKACLDCHADVETAQKGSRHAAISCEVCHGPLQAHAAAQAGGNSAPPEVMKPKRPDPAAATHLCLLCHQANVAKPKGFKQVDSKTHMGGGRCTDCHGHHAPADIKGAGGKAEAKKEAK